MRTLSNFSRLLWIVWLWLGIHASFAQPNTVLIIGDSFVAGTGASGSYGWAQRLQNNHPNMNFTISGVGGDNIRAVNNRLGNYPQQNFDVVILAIGLNDSRDRPSKGRNEVPLDEFNSAIRSFVSSFSSSNPDIRIFFVGLTRVDESKTTPYSEDKYYINANIAQYDQALQTLSTELSAQYIAVPALNDTQGMLSDGVHPSNDGHQALMNAVNAQVAPIFASLPPPASQNPAPSNPDSGNQPSNPPADNSTVTPPTAPENSLAPDNTPQTHSVNPPLNPTTPQSDPIPTQLAPVLVDPNADKWIRYAGIRSGLGTNGIFDDDLSAYPSETITLSLDINREYLLVSKNISSFLQTKPDTPDMIRLIRTPSGYYQYGSDATPGAILITLSISNNIMQGREQLADVTGYTIETFIIVPIGATDPRSQDIHRCVEGTISRLALGEIAVRNNDVGNINLFSIIDTPSSVAGEAPMVNVVAGPVCWNQMVWWQVSQRNTPSSIYWAIEIFSDGIYNMNPVRGSKPLPQVICDAIGSRLSVDAQVMTIIPDGQPIHTAPDQSSAIIATMSANDTYRALGEPLCIDGILWWQVESETINGWVIEARDATYWLEPSATIP